MGQIKHCDRTVRAGQAKEPPHPFLVSACLAFLEDWNFCFYLTLKRFVPGDNIKEIKCLREKKSPLLLIFDPACWHMPEISFLPAPT